MNAESLPAFFRFWPIALGPAFFTFFVSALLRYGRGAIARIGLGLAAAGIALSSHAAAHPWFLAVFYFYAAAGLAICGVGLHDRKPAAWPALFAVLSLVTGVALGRAAWGFLGFGVCFALGWLPRKTVSPETNDIVPTAPIPANNRTRRARSIPRKLLREGQLHFLPVYYLAMLSDLAREGVMNSGSYRFADHIYRMTPSGRGALGRWIDERFLRLHATQAFRMRYKHAQAAMRAALESFPVSEEPLRILAIPCGLPRDLTELAATLARENPALLARIEYHGMDIDPELLRLAEDFTASCRVPRRIFPRGNALHAADYPREKFHVIVSTGLGEFLQTPELETFYRNAHAALLPGGTFYTSATRHEKRSEALLRAFELITQYRTAEELDRILSRLPWSRLTLTPDPTGLQTFVVAVK